jgi:hypothetical protein
MLTNINDTLLPYYIQQAEGLYTMNHRKITTITLLISCLALGAVQIYLHSQKIPQQEWQLAV